MADTWQINAMGIAPGNGKSLLGIMNDIGSGKVIRIYRIWLLNNYTKNPYAGQTLNFEMRSITGLVVGGGSAVTPVKHDTGNPSLSTNIGIYTGGTASGESSSLIRLIAWCANEPLVATTSIFEVECLVPINCIWDTGYENSTIQPLTLREGEGVHIKCITNFTSGTLDICAEFTQSDS